MVLRKFILPGIVTVIIFSVGIAKGDNPINSFPPVKSLPIPACSVTQTGNCLVLFFNLDKGDVSVSIEDENGDTVYATGATATPGSSLAIDTSGWESGVYTLTVTGNSGTIYTTDILIL